MQLSSVKNLFRCETGETIQFDVSEPGEQFGFPEQIEVTKIVGKVTAIKLDDSIVASGNFVADATLICDRCLDNFPGKIKFSFEREYALDRKGESEDGLYVDKLGNIDLTNAIHDELLLAVPTQNFCKDDCPGICQGCGQNLNHEKCTCKIVK